MSDKKSNVLALYYLFIDMDETRDGTSVKRFACQIGFRLISDENATVLDDKAEKAMTRMSTRLSNIDGLGFGKEADFLRGNIEFNNFEGQPGTIRSAVRLRVRRGALEKIDDANRTDVLTAYLEKIKNEATKVLKKTYGEYWSNSTENITFALNKGYSWHSTDEGEIFDYPHAAMEEEALVKKAAESAGKIFSNISAENIEKECAFLDAEFGERWLYAVNQVKTVFEAAAENKDEKVMPALAAWLRERDRLASSVEYASASEVESPFRGIASLKDSRERAKFLADLGFSLNEGGDSGNTALHWAAKKGDAALIEELLSMGARADHANTKGELPCDVAAVEGHAEAARVLAEAVYEGARPKEKRRFRKV